MIIIVIIITIVIIIFMIIIFDLMRSLNLTPSGIPLGLCMFYGPFLARAINSGYLTPSGIPLGLRMFYGPFLARAINSGYYTVGRRYEFYFRVAKQYFTNERSE